MNLPPVIAPTEGFDLETSVLVAEGKLDDDEDTGSLHENLVILSTQCNTHMMWTSPEAACLIW